MKYVLVENLSPILICSSLEECSEYIIDYVKAKMALYKDKCVIEDMTQDSVCIKIEEHPMISVHAYEVAEASNQVYVSGNTKARIIKVEESYIHLLTDRGEIGEIIERNSFSYTENGFKYCLYGKWVEWKRV